VVGVFVVIVLFGLAYFTFILSGKKFHEQIYPMEAVFPDVMGLRTKDSVVVRGMPIGEVTDLELRPDGVHVLFEVVGHKGKPPPVVMRKDYRVTIVATSILGGRLLQVDEGSPEFGTLPPETVFKGRDPHDLMRDAAELFSELKKGLTEKGGVVESLKEASTNVREISQRLNAGKGTLGKLLSEDDALYNDLKSGVASLKAVLQRVEQGKGTVGKLFSEDDKLFEDLKSGVASLRKISERVEQGKGTLGKLLSEDDQVYRDLKDTVASMRTMAQRLEQGKGMLGKLLSEDESLYKEFSNVVTEAKAALDDLRETTPVVTFTSVLFGAF